MGSWGSRTPRPVGGWMGASAWERETRRTEQFRASLGTPGLLRSDPKVPTLALWSLWNPLLTSESHLLWKFPGIRAESLADHERKGKAGGRRPGGVCTSEQGRAARGRRARAAEQQPRNWCFPLRAGPGPFFSRSPVSVVDGEKALGELTLASSGLNCL